jgi:hypothetical protein
MDEFQQMKDQIKVKARKGLDSVNESTRHQGRHRLGSGHEDFDSYDWDHMSIDQWEKDLGIKDRRTDEQIQEDMDKTDLEDPFPEFIATLTKEEMMEIKEHEWKYMLADRFGDDIRKIFKNSDHEMILHVAKAFNWDDIEALFFDF